MSSTEIMEVRWRIVGGWMKTCGATGRSGSCMKDLQSNGGLGLDRNVGVGLRLSGVDGGFGVDGV